MAYTKFNSNDFHKKYKGYPLIFQSLEQITAIRNTFLPEYFLYPLGDDFFQKNIEMYIRESIRNNPNPKSNNQLLQEICSRYLVIIL